MLKKCSRHEVFNEVGKERVLADVEAWGERHLPRPERALFDQPVPLC